MKKCIALIIVAIMVLSMAPAMAPAASAEEWSYPEPSDGFWSIYRHPQGYEIEEGDTYTPAPGYHYTAEGFTTIPADYTNTTPYFTVQTSHPQDLKQGFYVKFRVDAFSYDGEEGEADEWLAFTVNDRPMVAPPSSAYGANWCTLMRGSGDGKVRLENHLTTADTDTEKGAWSFKGGLNDVPVPMDEEGREIYELSITWNGSAYDIKINGKTIAGMPETSAHLLTFKNCYVGITMQSGVKDGVASLTILEQGTSKDDAATPSGSDSAEPEENVCAYGDPINPSTVPENQPALLWDAHKTSFSKEPGGANLQFSATGNYTYHLKATDNICNVTWGIKHELTYLAEDFPVFAMMIKDYCGQDYQLYYSAGDVLGASDSYKEPWSMYDENAKVYGEDDEYALVVVDLTGKCEGRINALRVDFQVDITDIEQQEWDIEYMGMFRSVEEAHDYAAEYMQGYAPAETDTAAPSGDADDTSADTAAPGEGDTIASTADGTVSTDGEAKDDEPSGGCASVVGCVSVAILSAAAAVVLLKKKD